MILESPFDSVLQEDLEILAGSDLPLKKLMGQTILITGATGLIGSQLIRALACCNRKHNLRLHILALVRNSEKAEAIFGELIQREDIEIVCGDVTQDFHSYIFSQVQIDCIIHAASVTTSKMMIEHPVCTIATALDGTKNMLELAREKDVSCFLYISSMEVYGSFKERIYVSENDMGYIDPIKVRSNYPLCKRMCENLCIAYYCEYGTPIRIARLSQTFGAGILPGENRVFAQFAKSVINQTDIVLHTKGLSEGNYCYTRDTVSALILLMVTGKNGEAYNISNEDSHFTIADMAQMVAQKIAGGNINVVFDILENNVSGYADDTRMKLNTQKMQLLGWHPTVCLEESYQRLIQSMKETAV